MFKKKQKELTVDDAPDSLVPWEMLEEAEIADQTARLDDPVFRPRASLRLLGALDKDAVACFDKGTDGAGKAVLVWENVDAPAELTAERRFPGFVAWFDAALAEHRSL